MQRERDQGVLDPAKIPKRSLERFVAILNLPEIPGCPGVSGAHLVATVSRWALLPDVVALGAILRAHPELLSAEAEVILELVLEEARRTKLPWAGDVEDRQRLLARCRQMGVEKGLELGTHRRQASSAIEDIERLIAGTSPTEEPVKWGTLHVQLAARCRAVGTVDEIRERVIHLLTKALSTLTLANATEIWAAAHLQLTLAYENRKTGEPAENLEAVLAHGEQALRYFTAETHRTQWVTASAKVGWAYLRRLRGDRTANLEAVIRVLTPTVPHLGSALQLETAAQALWHLAEAYAQRVAGDRAKNIEVALELYRGADTIGESCSSPKFRLAAARTYDLRLVGDRRQNKELALKHAEAALEALRRSGSIVEIAEATELVASILMTRLAGNKAENVERAIGLLSAFLSNHGDELDAESLGALSTVLGTAYADRPTGDYRRNIERALEHYDRAIATLHDAQKRAKVLMSAAIAYRLRRDGSPSTNLERALALANEGLSLASRTSDPETWAQLQHNIGIVYRARIQGDRTENLESALEHLRAALDIFTESEYPDYWAMAHEALSMVLMVRQRGDETANNEQAIEHLTAALRVHTKEAFPFEWACGQDNLATLYLHRQQGIQKDNIERAIAHSTAALTVWTRETFPQAWAKNHQILFHLYTARVDGGRARNAEMAVKHSQAALSIFTRDAAPEDWADVHHSLAIHFRELGGPENIAQAIQHLRLALDVRTEDAYPRQHQHTARVLGDILFAQSRWTEAVAVYCSCLRVADLAYATAATTEAKQASLKAVAAIPPRLAFALVRSDERQAPGAVEVLEKGRARGLAEGLALELMPLDHMTSADQEAFGRLCAEVANLDAHGRRPDLDRGEFLRLSAELRERRRALERLLTKSAGLSSLTFHEIASAANDAILLYIVLTDHGGLALIICDGRVHPLWLQMGESSLAALLARRESGKEVGYLVAQMEGRLDLLEASLTRELSVVGERVVRPIRDRILQLVGSSRSRPVIFMPAGRLGLLPLHAVSFGDKNARCLVDDERISVSYAPSVRVLRASGPVKPTLVAVGDPKSHLKPLPFARVEAQEVARFFMPEARVVCGEEATVSWLLGHTACGSYVHLACHGSFDLFNPLESMVVLADGQLRAREILAQKIWSDVRLVVLSACQTAIFDPKVLPDESIGLATALLQAGARAVIGTLWPVNDVSAAILVLRFYELHLEGDKEQGLAPMSPAMALRHAQHWTKTATASVIEHFLEGHASLKASWRKARHPRDVKSAGSRETEYPFSHPYHWAPYVLLGR